MKPTDFWVFSLLFPNVSWIWGPFAPRTKAPLSWLVYRPFITPYIRRNPISLEKKSLKLGPHLRPLTLRVPGLGVFEFFEDQIPLEPRFFGFDYIEYFLSMRIFTKDFWFFSYFESQGLGLWASRLKLGRIVDLIVVYVSYKFGLDSPITKRDIQSTKNRPI